MMSALSKASRSYNGGQNCAEGFTDADERKTGWHNRLGVDELQQQPEVIDRSFVRHDCAVRGLCGSDAPMGQGQRNAEGFRRYRRDGRPCHRRRRCHRSRPGRSSGGVFRSVGNPRRRRQSRASVRRRAVVGHRQRSGFAFTGGAPRQWQRFRRAPGGGRYGRRCRCWLGRKRWNCRCGGRWPRWKLRQQCGWRHFLLRRIRRPGPADGRKIRGERWCNRFGRRSRLHWRRGPRRRGGLGWCPRERRCRNRRCAEHRREHRDWRGGELRGTFRDRWRRERWCRCHRGKQQRRNGRHLVLRL
jgi:hypothetical protein